jgi:hypothetical protein
MSIAAVFLVLAVLCGIFATVSAVLVTRFLDQRGLTTPFPFIRLFLFRNLGRYKEITRSETGKAGPLFYSYVISINAALVLALIALALRSTGM